MIQLEFMKNDENRRNKVVKEYYDELAKRSLRINELDNWCDRNLDMKSLISKKYDSKVKSFEKIVSADLKTIIKIRDYISSNNIAMDDKLKKYMLNTMYAHNINRIKFVEVLGVTVCPYCNRNYINSNKNTTNCQFDHFINKSNYPILAVSFYNLVPVCPSCNHIKSDKDFSYSPYDDDATTDQMLTFSYLITGVNYLSDSSKLKIVLNRYRNEKLKDNIELLDLDNLYQIHSDIVQELIKKKEIYVDEYIDHLGNKFKKLFKSTEEVERLVTGVYTSQDDYGKRPLSKMITDISKELGLIKEK
ncbi:HNH endonuclease family protein [Clostridium butyricum]|nr:HNH endonuclease family protein [Clostridium butyricum]